MITICGVIGFSSPQVTSKDLEILMRVMIESRIRGKHASGIAWFDGSSIQSYIKPISIDKLVEQFNFDKLMYEGSKVSMIAHARYSTSDIRYNQPIVGKSIAVAHNGVVTQTDPKTWKTQFGYSCTTKNDSELLLRAVEHGDNLIKKFPDSSIAAVFLNNQGKITTVRNAQRPLWSGKIGKGLVYASTYDILNRAGVRDITQCPMSDTRDDLQRRNFKQWIPTHKT